MKGSASAQLNYPTPVPNGTLGTVHYYRFRYTDFLKRYPDEIPPHYYLKYGDKYVNKFTEVLYGRLSPEGKLWMMKTRFQLQLEMEQKLSNDPLIELNETKFDEFAFESHARIYKNTGVMELPFKDRLAVLFSMDLKDLFGRLGWEAIKVGLYCRNHSSSFSSSFK